MKQRIDPTGSSTANLIAAVRSSLEVVREQLSGGEQNEEAKWSTGQLELLEQLLTDQDARLRSFDMVLEEFNYSVAHELCAPLHRICGFTREIRLRYAPQLDEEGVSSLDQILESCQRMSEMIDTLMQISRISRLELQKRTVDLSEVADEMGRELSLEMPERDVIFAIQPRLCAACDPALLRVAVRRLFENACRFTERQQPAIIELGVVDVEEGKTFFVRDNGIGFDPDQAKRLFQPFMRLHADSGGMGLTLVKKIIERHGGQVWAEGERDKGATFFFTLPA